MELKQPDVDEFNEVINSDKTYEAVAERLERHTSVVLGWTDEIGSHHDILLCVTPLQSGELQGGMHSLTDLFVAVRGGGMFGFKLDGPELHADYVAEKLGMSQTVTIEALTNLINEVRKRL